MMKQMVGKLQISLKIAFMIRTKSMKRRQYFAVTAFKSRMKGGSKSLGYRHVNKPPIIINGGIPAAVCLVNADSNEQCLHVLSQF